jgi:F-type H+-transporting ATPase subunit delta
MDSSKMTTIARPYATAAFEVASTKQDFGAWEIMLASAANITRNETIMQMLANPDVTQQQLLKMYFDLLGEKVDTQKKNFLSLLAENSRLAVLPEIAVLFNAALAAQEKKLHVTAIAATPLSDTYQQKLVQALTKRLHRQVELHCEVEPDLLGGVIIRAGDTVIDGSVRGKLARLNEFI